MDVEARVGVCWWSQTDGIILREKYSLQAGPIGDLNCYLGSSWTTPDERLFRARAGAHTPSSSRGMLATLTGLWEGLRGRSGGAMDASILAMFPDDDHVLGPFLGNLPPQILDEVVARLGWFQTTFALAGKTCRESVERAPGTRAAPTAEELDAWRRAHGEDELRRWYPLVAAAVEGDVEALDFLTRRTRLGAVKKSSLITRCAAERGRLAFLRRLHAKGFPWDADACECAASRGHLDVLKWGRDVGGESWNARWGRAAAREGRLEVLKWSRDEIGIPWDIDLCNYAASGGHLETLRWLRRNGCPWREPACANAAWDGHLETLRWLRENGCPWDQRTCSCAASGGHLEVLKWARQNGCPWGKGTCQAAAKEGHLEVLQWLRRNGCEWDENTCAWAASAGRLETLRWARENGCPWNEKACMYAAKGGHLETLMWLEENGCPTLTDAAERGGRVGESWLGVHPRCRPYLNKRGGLRPSFTVVARGAA